MLVNIEDMSAEQLFELAAKRKRDEEIAARRAAAMGQLNELRKQREQLMRDYEQALAANDKAMQALQKEREQLITRHQAAVAVIDRNLTDLENGIEAVDEPVEAKPAAAPKAVAPAAVAPSKTAVAPAKAVEAPPAKAVEPPPAKAVEPPAVKPAATQVEEQPKKSDLLEPPFDQTVKIQVKPPVEKYQRDEMALAIMEIVAGRPSISESLLKEQLRTRGFATTDLGKTLERLVREGKLTNKGYGNFAAVKRR